MVEFDPDFASAPEWARLYRNSGVQVVPCKNKVPCLSSWKGFQNALVDDAQFNSWYGEGGQFSTYENMGMLTGEASGRVLMIDLDIYKPEGHKALAWWQALMAVHNNGMELETWEQVTGGGGRQMFFSYPAGWSSPNAKTSLHVDIRCKGGFAVLPPTRHESGGNYAWVEGHAPWETDILAAPEWLLEAVTGLIQTYGGGTAPSGGNGRVTNSGATGEAIFDDFGNQIDLREDKMFRMVWRCLVQWRRECPLPINDKYLLERARQEFPTYVMVAGPKEPQPGVSREQALDAEGRGWKVWWGKWRYAAKKWDTKIAEEAAKPDPHPDVEWDRAAWESTDRNLSPDSTVETIKVRSAFPIDESQIPPRDWVIPGLLLKRNVTMLVAPPGIGKSLLSLQWGIMLGVALTWAGWTPRKPEKVLIINAEDDGDELNRRLAIAAREMGVPQSNLIDQVILAEDPQSIVIAAKNPMTRSIVRTPLYERIKKTIIDNGIGVAVVDPFAETFDADESNNSEVKWAGMMWRDIARECGITLILVHHTRKYASEMAGNADASRGGGSMIGIARNLVTLFEMTKEEAQNLGIPEDKRADFVRFDDAKANHSRKALMRWFEKKSVELNNATAFLPADDVGVLVPWQPPGLMEGVAMPSLSKVWNEIDRGVPDQDGKPSGSYYALKATSSDKSRWVGRVLMRHLGIDEAKARKILHAWHKEGVIEDFEYRDAAQRKTRTGVKTNPQKRPDIDVKIYD